MIQPVAEFLTPEQLSARYLGRIALDTLEKWRRDRIGPAYYKLGGKVLYALADVLAWEDKRRVAFDNSSPRTGRSPLTRDLLTGPARIVEHKEGQGVVLLSLPDAAAALGLTQEQVRALLRSGDLEAVCIAGDLVISRSSVDAFAARIDAPVRLKSHRRRKRRRKAVEPCLLTPPVATRDAAEKPPRGQRSGRAAQKFSGPSPAATGHG